MAPTRGHRAGKNAQEEPEPTTAQILATFIRLAEEQRAEREERRSEKLARREAKEARLANENARWFGAPRQGTLDQFFKLRPTPFYGTEDALVADDWLKEITNFLDAAVIADGQRVTMVKLLLKGNARIWWEAEAQHYVALDMVPTWDQFCRGFLKKFFPATQEAQMEAKFANLEQGSMTVDQYAAEFIRLSRFCPVIAASPSEMTKKFRRGLRAEIRDTFVFLHMTTFDEVLEAARFVEPTKPRVTTTVQQSSQKSSVHHLHHFQLTQQQPQRSHVQIGQDERNDKSIVCRFCRKPGHSRKDCRLANKLCLACGAPDHSIASCPERSITTSSQQKSPATGQVQQKQIPSARQDTYRQQGGSSHRRAQALQMIAAAQEMLQEAEEPGVVQADLQ